MQYISTRGGMPAANFSTILLAGLAPDGGLAVPTIYPEFNWQHKLSSKYIDYGVLSAEIINLYAPEIPFSELKNITKKVYSKCNFNSDEITPLKFLDDDNAILELSNGPTYAFKDIALQLLGELFSRQLKNENRQLNILGATSGDTGSSAEYAMRGRENINIFMLSPLGRMSAFQKAQMYSLQDKNIFNLAVCGVFDECQNIVKFLAQDLEFKKQANLGAVNSINWARICAQIVYYFYGYINAVAHGWDKNKISFVVPSGNFGNVLAGHVARQMGLPINRLIVATNENNVLEECINTGVYRPRKASDVEATSSPSMDISAASNFERYVFDLQNRDPDKHRVLWNKLSTEGSIDFKSENLFEKINNSDKYPHLAMSAGKSSHQHRIKTIAEIWKKNKRLIDPHTADAFVVGAQKRKNSEKLIFLETAQPVKFAETIFEAVGFKPELPSKVSDLLSLPQNVVEVGVDANEIKKFILKNI